MSEAKTQPTDIVVEDFVQAVENVQRREDALVLLKIYLQITGENPVMWGPSIIGYGRYQYTLANGKESIFMRSGFSPRKQNLVLYVGSGLRAEPEFLTKLGKYKSSKACLYLNKLADVDLSVLQRLIKLDLYEMNRKYPE